jgi:hypothetical protein
MPASAARCLAASSCEYGMMCFPSLAKIPSGFASSAGFPVSAGLASSAGFASAFTSVAVDDSAVFSSCCPTIRSTVITEYLAKELALRPGQPFRGIVATIDGVVAVPSVPSSNRLIAAESANGQDAQARADLRTFLSTPRSWRTMAEIQKYASSLFGVGSDSQSRG